VRIGVVGAGGLGGYFGGRLARTGAEVHFVARGAHLAALRRGGLRVRSVRGDFEVAVSASDDPAEIGACDVVLFCVKSFDTETAAAALPPLLHDRTGVLTLQNGVDNVEKLAAAIGGERVLAGAAYILASIAEPGVIQDVGGPGSIVFGELDGSRSERAERLLRWFERAEIPARLDADIQAQLWDKLSFICALAGMTAASRRPIGDIRARPEPWAMFRRIVEEVVALAGAEGVPLAADTVDRHCGFAERLEPGATSSLYHDLVHGKRLELEALHGFVVRRARRHALAVPACEAVYALLEPSVDGDG
jgi:2-dehydropantoate 2-reductase